MPPNAAIRVALFAVSLVAAFGGAFAIGSALDPNAGDGDATAHSDGVVHKAAFTERADASGDRAGDDDHGH
jgi:hypothetical protein